MKRHLVRRLAALVGGTALVAGLLGSLSAAPASALVEDYGPVIGRLTGFPGTGATVTPFPFFTTSACPVGTTVVNVFVDSADAGLVSAVAVGSDSASVPTMMLTGMPIGFALVDVARNVGRTLVNGSYTVSLVCLPDVFGSAPLGHFEGTFVVTGGATPTDEGTTYTFATPRPTGVAFDGLPSVTQSAGPSTVDVLTTPPDATGTLRLQEIVAGAPVDLATVRRTGRPTPVTVDLAPGDHTLQVTFAPDDLTAFEPATSAPATTTVTRPGTVTPTTTTLVPDLTELVDGDPAGLQVVVSPPAPGGVTIREGDRVVPLAPPEPLQPLFDASGRARVTLLDPPTVGTHVYTATFEPAQPLVVGSSTSAPVTVVVVPKVQTTLRARAKVGRPDDCSPKGRHAERDEDPVLVLRAVVTPADAVGGIGFDDVSGARPVQLTPPIAPVDGRVCTVVPLRPGIRLVQARYGARSGSRFLSSDSPVVRVRRD